jgi:hypothetical protein
MVMKEQRMCCYVQIIVMYNFKPGVWKHQCPDAVKLSLWLRTDSGCIRASMGPRDRLNAVQEHPSFIAKQGKRPYSSTMDCVTNMAESICSTYAQRGEGRSVVWLCTLPTHYCSVLLCPPLCANISPRHVCPLLYVTRACRGFVSTILVTKPNVTLLLEWNRKAYPSTPRLAISVCWRLISRSSWDTRIYIRSPNLQGVPKKNNFESLYKFIRRTCTVFWTVIM